MSRACIPADYCQIVNQHKFSALAGRRIHADFGILYTTPFIHNTVQLSVV